MAKCYETKSSPTKSWISIGRIIKKIHGEKSIFIMKMVDWIKDGVSEEKKLFVDMASTRILGSYLMFIQAVPKMVPKLVATLQLVELIKNGL